MDAGFVYPFLLALLAALAAGLVGSFALMRRMSLAGDAISHIALPGLGLAFLLKFNPLLGAAATLLLGALLIWQLEKRTGLDTEAVVGVVFTASLAGGALITPGDDLVEALFGGFRSLSHGEFILATILGLAVLAGLFHWKDQFLIHLFSPELAAASGLRRSRLNLIFLLLFTATVLLGLRFLGALLAGALIVIPATVARQWTQRLSAFLTISAAVSVFSVGTGLVLAHWRHLQQGPVVVIVASILFLASLISARQARRPYA
jgi:ABC-type Mn2+/Zn2+ transport system permease subunit